MEMNNTDNGSEEITNQTQNSSKSKISFGENLRQAREERRLSIEQSSKDLYIKARQLEALEAEDFDNLPQMTFTRGFAVKYAQYLGLGKEETTKSFDRAYPDRLKVKTVEDIQAPIRPMGTLNRGSNRKFHFNPVLLIGCVLVFALAVFLIKTVSSAEEENNTPTLIEEGISTTEQRQGASLDSKEGLGSAGSAINLDDSSDSN